jgi:hypothetical protein
MTETMKVRPSVEGAVIIDPAVNEVLPADGKDVPASAYWHGLVIRGDVILVIPESAVKPSKSTPKEA